MWHNNSLGSEHDCASAAVVAVASAVAVVVVSTLVLLATLLVPVVHMLATDEGSIANALRIGHKALGCTLPVFLNIGCVQM